MNSGKPTIFEIQLFILCKKHKTNKYIYIQYIQMSNIITEIQSTDEFYNILQQNNGVVIIKFGAIWCGPCKKISPIVHQWFNNLKDNDKIQLAEIDVDHSFEIYAYLKTKKMVKGIPAILAYYKGNTTFAVDDSVSGTDEHNINAFFEKCLNESAKY